MRTYIIILYTAHIVFVARRQSVGLFRFGTRLTPVGHSLTYSCDGEKAMPIMIRYADVRRRLVS